MGSTRRMPAAQSETSSWSKTLGWICTGLFGFLVNLLTIYDTLLNRPHEITTPLGYVARTFDSLIIEPVSECVRYLGDVFSSSFHENFVPIAPGVGSPHLLASVLLGVVGLVVLYGATMALLKIYDAVRAMDTLQESAVVGLTLLSLPLACLAIVHIIKIRLHIDMTPAAENLLLDYRLLVHTGVGALYWIPFHFFSLHIPPWFKDLAALSIVSVGMARRAALVPETPWTFDFSWSDIRPFMSEWKFDDVFDIVLFPISLVSLIISLGITSVVSFLSFRWKGLSSAVGAIAYVVFRGVMLGGIVVFLNFVWYLPTILGLRKTKAEWSREGKRRARIYGLYLSVTLGMVIWFFWAFEFGSRGM